LLSKNIPFKKLAECNNWSLVYKFSYWSNTVKDGKPD
jgi:hypothetical protein